MPVAQRVIMVVCAVGLAVVVVPLLIPNRCGEIRLRAGTRSKGEIHTSAGERLIRTVAEQQAQRACVGDSRRSVVTAAVVVSILGTILVALVIVPTIKRRAWRGIPDMQGAYPDPCRSSPPNGECG